MKTVFKYKVDVGPPMSVKLPADYKILHVESQTWGGSISFWAEIKPWMISWPHIFCVYGTGQDIPDNAKWIGTSLSDSDLVWHLYELMDDKENGL